MYEKIIKEHYERYYPQWWYRPLVNFIRDYGENHSLVKGFFEDLRIYTNDKKMSIPVVIKAKVSRVTLFCGRFKRVVSTLDGFIWLLSAPRLLWELWVKEIEIELKRLDKENEECCLSIQEFLYRLTISRSFHPSELALEKACRPCNYDDLKFTQWCIEKLGEQIEILVKE